MFVTRSGKQIHTIWSLPRVTSRPGERVALAGAKRSLGVTLSVKTLNRPFCWALLVPEISEIAYLIKVIIN